MAFFLQEFGAVLSVFCSNGYSMITENWIQLKWYAKKWVRVYINTGKSLKLTFPLNKLHLVYVKLQEVFILI